jgi:peptidyl-dipeptidase Dcp
MRTNGKFLKVKNIIPIMKKLMFAVMAIAAMSSCGDNIRRENPLLKETNSPHDTPLFAEIKLEHYMPAFEYAMAEAKKEIAAVVDNSEAPSFENTIVALERAGGQLSHIAMIFFALNSAETSAEMQALAQEMQPALVAYSNDIYLDPVLFERVKAVYSTREGLELDDEQHALLEKTYKAFVRGGAGLDDAQKEEYRKLSEELSKKTLQFEQNVLAATNAFTLNIPPSQADRVAELPEFVREGMAVEAKARGEEGWTVTLQQSSLSPFLTYSSDRELKEQLWRKNNTKCMEGDANDNQQIVKDITSLRLKIANLLGYPTYAAYVLEEQMAENVPTVNRFLEELLADTKEYAVKDYRTIEQYALKNGKYGSDFKLMPWDFAYFNEKYKTEKYALNDEEVKPYLELESVKKGIFLLAEKLYGIRFVENKDIQVYHPDVMAYEVFEENGDFTGVLYMDFFPRTSKRAGAWMTSFREMYTTADGTEVRPLVTMCVNFTKPTETTPSLLTFDEFETFLHEFGHSLHGLFAEGKYASVTGTNVYRDFVELPSQIMENWATEKEFLDLFAVHYKTGEKIPQELVDKIVAAKNYLAAYLHVRQLSFGIDDMAFHSITEPITADIETFEKNAIAETTVAPDVKGTALAPSFSHIFAGSYAAGYYSYKWAEVLEADAYSLFEEKGIFNREVARSFRDNILSKGGSRHPMILYVNFRGHKPETQALIDRMGLK